MTSWYVLPATILLLFFIRKYRESKWGKCKNNVKLDGKIAIVTGANSGIGLEIAKELALRNAQVILACRNIEKANKACQLIKAELWRKLKVVLIPMELDLASLHSIRNFVVQIKKQYKEINLLINNAGVYFPNDKRVETKDGFEIHFGVNYLGHFYLTSLLLELLMMSSTFPTLDSRLETLNVSRVIFVTSTLFKKGKINLDDLNSLTAPKEANLYSNSKLATLYLAHELANRTDYNKIRIFACCPGWVYTKLFRHSLKWYHYILVAPIAFLYMRSPKQGAQTPIYCATENILEDKPDLLYADCQCYNEKVIFYDNISCELWQKSQDMINNIVNKS